MDGLLDGLEDRRTYGRTGRWTDIWMDGPQESFWYLRVNWQHVGVCSANWLSFSLMKNIHYWIKLLSFWYLKQSEKYQLTRTLRETVLSLRLAGMPRHPVIHICDRMQKKGESKSVLFQDHIFPISHHLYYLLDHLIKLIQVITITFNNETICGLV